jgi:hypothetical protein
MGKIGKKIGGTAGEIFGNMLPFKKGGAARGARLGKLRTAYKKGGKIRRKRGGGVRR